MSDGGKLHIFFFPLMASGHMIPMSDMAKLFASRGVKSTLIATPANIPSLLQSTEGTRMLGFDIDVITIKLPLEEVGLPEHVQNINYIKTPDMQHKFNKALTMLDGQLEELMEQHRPDYLVADTFLPWTTAVAAKVGVPRVAFHFGGYFSVGASECMSVHQPYKNVSSDSEPFLIPQLSWLGEITLTRAQLPDNELGEETDFSRLINEMRQSDLTCYGVLMNSFYELESAYIDHYNDVLGRRSWSIGPLFTYDTNNIIEEKKLGNGYECLKWLDSKEPDSVIYVCFGSTTVFNTHQLRETAVGLEASGQQFVWVVKKGDEDVQGPKDWLPERYEDRMRDKGLILVGWAPQRSILQHKAVGGFVTHCGWNSTLEGIVAGVAMVTWPQSAEQFYNEKLVTRVLGIGTPVGVERWMPMVGDEVFHVESEKVEKAVKRVMVGEEAEEMRIKVRELSEMAKKAVQVGGSSHRNIDSFLEELSSRKIISGAEILKS